jgi:hypothetical protein
MCLFVSSEQDLKLKRCVNLIFFNDFTVQKVNQNVSHFILIESNVI